MADHDDVTEALLLVIGLLLDRMGNSNTSQRLDDLEAWRKSVEAVWEDIINETEG